MLLFIYMDYTVSKVSTSVSKVPTAYVFRGKQHVPFFLVCPRSRCYGRTAALRLIVQPSDEDDDYFFPLFRVMEHRWNENDRGKPKYSGENLSQCHFVHHKSLID
jgi:hypothetical protein